MDGTAVEGEEADVFGDKVYQDGNCLKHQNHLWGVWEEFCFAIHKSKTQRNKLFVPPGFFQTFSFLFFLRRKSGHEGRIHVEQFQLLFSQKLRFDVLQEDVS